MENQYYIIVNERREGPFTLPQLAKYNLGPNTLVWTAGLSGWTRADSLPELSHLVSASPAMGGYHPAEEQYPKYSAYSNAPGTVPPDPASQYRDPIYAAGGTNWKTLAIIATVTGFLFSCIGGFIGFFAILQANQAEEALRYGDGFRMKSALSTCKTLTIISLILSGIGLLANISILFLLPGGIASLYAL
ncbi:MAG: DUF4339 domain-containing protein [Muribaculaceae bacterium]|nr:DUF4339 domain-containing protein [Muribaculaceae bacterium]